MASINSRQIAWMRLIPASSALLFLFSVAASAQNNPRPTYDLRDQTQFRDEECDRSIQELQTARFQAPVVIFYDGLMGYNAYDAARIKYPSAGLMHADPDDGFGHLAKSLMSKNRSFYNSHSVWLYYPESDSHGRNQAIACLRKIRSSAGIAREPFPSVSVVGYSNGAHAGWKLIRDAQSAGIPILYFFTVDLVPQFSLGDDGNEDDCPERPRSLRRWVNFYQREDDHGSFILSSIRGKSCRSADVNTQVRGVGRAGHLRILNASEVNTGFIDFTQDTIGLTYFIQR